MTVDSTTNRVTYSGNGVTVDFAFPYPLAADSDLVIIATVVATGVDTTKLLGTHYSFAGTQDAQGRFPDGGTVTALVAPPSTEIWTIFRDPPAIQELDLVENDGAPAEAQEAQFDYLTMLLQRVKEQVTRTLHQSDSDVDAMTALPATILRANKYLYFDSSGNPSVVDAASSSGTSVIATGTTTAALLADRFRREVWAEDEGAIGDGVTDDSVVIQALINLIGAAGGGVIRFLAKRYALALKLVNTYNNVLLKGAGSGGASTHTANQDYLTAGTVFTWTGAVGGTMYDLGPQAGAAYGLYGGGIDGIFFEGNGVAATGILMRSVKYAYFDLAIEECTTVGLDLDVEATVTTDPPDLQHNRFAHITVIQESVTAGVAIRLQGAPGTNVSLNHFGFLHLFIRDSVGLELLQDDGNVYDHVFVHGAGNYGIVFGAGTAPLYSRDNVFTYVQPGGMGVLAKGLASGSTPSKKNRILHYSRENGAPLPTIEAGASLDYDDYDGQKRFSRVTNPPKTTYHNTSKTAAITIMQQSYTAVNSADEEVEYAAVDFTAPVTTDAAEEGKVTHSTKIAGVKTTQLVLGDGVLVGNPTGGVMGTGSLNVGTDIYNSGSMITGVETVTYSASMTPDQRLGASHAIGVTDNVNFVVNDITHAVAGDRPIIKIKNISGGAIGTVTWGASYRLGAAFTQPASDKSRSIEFLVQGGLFIETTRSPADVAN